MKLDDKNLKSDNKDLKIYILIFCTCILYSVLIVFNYIPLKIFNIIDLNNDLLYNVIYQVFAIAVSLLFFVCYKKKTYEDIVHNVKSALIGIGSISAYFLLSELQLVPFQLLDIDISKIPLYLKVIYLICYEAILAGIIILINIRKIKKDIADIKENHKTYFKTCIKYWLISLFVMCFSNLIINQLGSELPNNEEIIRNQFSISPIYIFVSAVIFAPIIEELIFRRSFKNIFSNKWLFIIISSLVFSGMHVFNGNTTLIDLLYIIPYGAPGFAFAYMLSKTDNIFVSMGFHALHNGILVGLQFLMIFFF